MESKLNKKRTKLHNIFLLDNVLSFLNEDELKMLLFTKNKTYIKVLNSRNMYCLFFLYHILNQHK